MHNVHRRPVQDAQPAYLSTTMTTLTTPDTLCLVFVHGFRGDHTSFQSFPTDLHLHLLPHVPKLQTYVYPTYKTARPLELARDQFLEWMKTLPPGGVILCGHSMGGLLTAEVAFAAPPGRVIGLISFDVPFLGVHPHVVLSGIASLFKKKEGRDEADLNDPQHVAMVSKQAGRPYLQDTNSSISVGLGASTSPLHSPLNGNRSPPPATGSPLNTPPPIHPSRASPKVDIMNSNALPASLHLSQPTAPVRVVSPRLEQAFETFGLGPIPQSVHDMAHFFHKHRGITGIKDWIVQIFEFGGCLLVPQGLINRYERMQAWGSDETTGPYGRGWVNLWTVTVPKRRGDMPDGHTLTPQSEDREADLAEAMSLSTMMGEEAGSNSFSPEPSILSGGESSMQSSQSRSDTLATTISTSPSGFTQSSKKSEDIKEALDALQAQIAMTSISKEEKVALKEKEKELKSEQKTLEKEEKAARKEEERRAKEAEKQAKREAKERQKALDAAAKRAREADKIDSPHHFIVLPRQGTDQNWIRIPVAGADSEVTAHCGLFFREENHEYDRMVSDVGNIVRSFWDGKGGTRHQKPTS
ncbi:alpha/beta hydrolase family protein [Rhizoctonia solani AG-3 Rhs1AP]|uniref:Alpha/beta hydrolase family protein n=1 Tax=Rhizoctonia solani AG-3 Rhs1AP TaxID=1086054 RepID=X8JBS2_9AGAM|nr:alpha/beta hydrolase family protein [Rhizoctonia solani AG-3 Rhs1AP]